MPRAGGAINRALLESGPLLRHGDVLEPIPGMITEQRSGTGKANLSFLRGFTLLAVEDGRLVAVDPTVGGEVVVTPRQPGVDTRDAAIPAAARSPRCLHAHALPRR
jgi:hypothetical protein